MGLNGVCQRCGKNITENLTHINPKNIYGIMVYSCNKCFDEWEEFITNRDIFLEVEVIRSKVLRYENGGDVSEDIKELHKKGKGIYIECKESVGIFFSKKC